MSSLDPDFDFHYAVNIHRESVLSCVIRAQVLNLSGIQTTPLFLLVDRVSYRLKDFRKQIRFLNKMLHSRFEQF